MLWRASLLLRGETRAVPCAASEGTASGVRHQALSETSTAVTGRPERGAGLPRARGRPLAFLFINSAFPSLRP